MSRCAAAAGGDVSWGASTAAGIDVDAAAADDGRRVEAKPQVDCGRRDDVSIVGRPPTTRQSTAACTVAVIEAARARFVSRRLQRRGSFNKQRIYTAVSRSSSAHVHRDCHASPERLSAVLFRR